MHAALLLAAALFAAAPAAGPARAPEGGAQEALARVLDDWHRAAAQADEARYFGHFTADAVFLGTDATERWGRDAFRAWARPYFARGRAWSFTVVQRHVTLGPGGDVAWFDEALSTPNMGPARGSGVAVRTGGRWKIAQYNLSVPIPNALLPDVVKRIAAASGGAGAASDGGTAAPPDAGR